MYVYGEVERGNGIGVMVMSWTVLSKDDGTGQGQRAIGVIVLLDASSDWIGPKVGIGAGPCCSGGNPAVVVTAGCSSGWDVSVGGISGGGIGNGIAEGICSGTEGIGIGTSEGIGRGISGVGGTGTWSVIVGVRFLWLPLDGMHWLLLVGIAGGFIVGGRFLPSPPHEL